MSGPTECNLVQGYVDPNFPNPLGPSDACIVIYGYTPALSLCILGVVLFFLAFSAQLYLLLRYRTWYFSTIVFGTLMEVVGYIFRTLSSQKDPYSVIFFVVQYSFIVVAPVLFSAAIYTIITIMINRVGREYAPLPPKAILWTFILCDVVATVIQSLGSALIGVAYANRKDPHTPGHILLAGLAFQVFSFAIFIVCLSLFLHKSKKVTTVAFKRYSAAVFFATMAVYLRTCFRLAEIANGLHAFISNHEVFFGCLDFLPIVVAIYILIYWHPGRWLGSKRSKGKLFE